MNARGLEALALTLPFDEMQLLRDNAAYVKHALGLKRVDIYGPSDAVRYAVHPIFLLCFVFLFCFISNRVSIRNRLFAHCGCAVQGIAEADPRDRRSSAAPGKPAVNLYHDESAAADAPAA